MVTWRPSLTITSSPGEGTPCSHSEVSCSSALSARASLECIRNYGVSLFLKHCSLCFCSSSYTQFRSYHQSEIVYINDMYLPLGTEWQYFASAEIADNRTGLVRRYEGPKEAACRVRILDLKTRCILTSRPQAWLQDLKMWRKLQ